MRSIQTHHQDVVGLRHSLPESSVPLWWPDLTTGLSQPDLAAPWSCGGAGPWTGREASSGAWRRGEPGRWGGEGRGTPGRASPGGKGTWTAGRNPWAVYLVTGDSNH